MQCLGQWYSTLHDTDDKTTDDIDQHDDDGSDRIAADEFAGTVHRAVKICFRFDGLPPLPRLGLVDEAGIQVRVNRQLFSGHGIQGKTRCHFSHTPGAAVDDRKLNDHQDQEDHHTHDIIAADDQITECSNDLPCFSAQQNQSADGNIESQPEQGDHQQGRLGKPRTPSAG